MGLLFQLICVSALIVAMSANSLWDDSSDDDDVAREALTMFHVDDEDEDFLSLIDLDPNELMPDANLPKDSKISSVIKGQATLVATPISDLKNDTIMKFEEKNTIKETRNVSVGEPTDNGTPSFSAVNESSVVNHGNVSELNVYGTVNISAVAESTIDNNGNDTNTNKTGKSWKYSKNKKCMRFGNTKRNCRRHRVSKYGYGKRRRETHKKIAMDRWRESKGHLEGKISHFCAHVNRNTATHMKKPRKDYMEKKLAKLPAEKRQSIKEEWIHHRQELQKCCQLAVNEQKACVDKTKLERIDKVCKKETPLCPFIEYHLGSKAPMAENNFMKCCEIKGGEEKLVCFRNARREMQKLKNYNKQRRMKRVKKL